MAKPIGFTSRKQVADALRAELSDRGRLKTPIIELSPEALETPLPDGWLCDVRDFLTRSGEWADHSIKSAEHFVAIPAIGVIVDEPMPRVIGDLTEAVFVSLGFGNATYTEEFSCDVNNCPRQEIGPRDPGDGDDPDPKCTANFCDEQTCRGLDCTGNDCTDHDCSRLSCDPQRAEDEFISALQANKEHPFVRDLRKHFRVDSIDALTSAVQGFVAMNGFDASLAR